MTKKPNMEHVMEDVKTQFINHWKPEIKIDKNVPIQRSKYDHLLDMEVGDSFCVPKSKRTLVTSFLRMNKIKYLGRSISEKECRIWRVG